ERMSAGFGTSKRPGRACEPMQYLSPARVRRIVLRFGIWDFSGIWNLDFGILLIFGIWNFEFGISTLVGNIRANGYFPAAVPADPGATGPASPPRCPGF